MKIDRDYLTCAQLAKRLNISIDKIYRLRKKADFPNPTIFFRKNGRHRKKEVRYHLIEVIEYLNNN